MGYNGEYEHMSNASDTLSIVEMIERIEAIPKACASFTKQSWNGHWNYSVSGNHNNDSFAITGTGDTITDVVRNAHTKLLKMQIVVPEAFGMLPPPTPDPVAPEDYTDVQVANPDDDYPF